MAERGEYRAFSLGLRDDPEFQATTPATKLVFHYLVYNLGRTGIGAVYPGAIEAQTGLTREDLERAYAELQGDGQRAFDVCRDGHLVWIVHRLEDEPTFNARDAKHRKGVATHVATLPARSPLVAAFRAWYGHWLSSEGPAEPMRRLAEPILRSTEGPSEALPRPSEASESGSESGSENRSESEAARAHEPLAPPASPEDARPLPVTGPLASALFAPLVRRLRDERYFDATAARWGEVVEQLEAVLTPEGTPLKPNRPDGRRVRAESAVLARAMSAALTGTARKRDSTIYVILLKCTSGDAVTAPDENGDLPSEAHAKRVAAERARAEREAAAEDREVAAWLEAHPEERPACAKAEEVAAPHEGPPNGLLAEARAQMQAAARRHFVRRRRAELGELAEVP